MANERKARTDSTVFGEWYRRLTTEVIDQETVLILVMAATSGYMLWGTTQFDIQSAARFPRLTASVVLVGSVLLLVRDFLPEPLRNPLVASGGMFEADEEFAERQEIVESVREAGTSADERAISTVGRPVHDSLFTSLSVIAYAILGYSVGLLWATPLFVVAYGVWFRLRPLYTALLAAIAFGIAYSFMIVLNVPMDGGAFLLTEGVSWLP